MGGRLEPGVHGAPQQQARHILRHGGTWADQHAWRPHPHLHVHPHPHRFPAFPHLVGEVVDLLREAGAGVHDQSPQVLAAGHAGDEQAVVVALLHVLLHPVVCNIVVVAA